MSKLIHYSGPNGSYILPSGYTRLAYIQSTGSLWVDTVVANGNEVKVQIEQTFEDVSQNNKAGVNGGLMWGIQNGKLATANVNINQITVLNGNRFLIEAGHDTDGVRYMSCSGYKVTTTTSTATGNIILCKAVYDSYTNLKGKIYKCNIWKNGLLVRDFIPVQKSDGTIGLLDLVNNTFYGNSGTGTFVAGPECPQGFPTSEYCLVEWLLDDGNLHFQLDLDLKTDDVLDTVISIYRKNPVSGNENCIAGSANDAWEWYYNDAPDTRPMVGDNHTCVTPAAGTGIVLNLRIAHLSKMKKDASGTWYICKYRTNGNLHALNGRMEKFSITRSGSKILDLIPCYRRSDMKPGMYDLIGREFYTNNGTGEFLLGPSITFGLGEVVNACGEGSNIITPKAGTRSLKGVTITKYTDGSVVLNGTASDTGATGLYGKTEFTTVPGCKYSFVLFPTNSYTNNKVYLNYWCDVSGYTQTCSNNTKGIGTVTTSTTLPTDYNIGIDVVKGTVYNNVKINVGMYRGYVALATSHALPHNISTGDGRNGEKNGSFCFNGSSSQLGIFGFVIPNKFTVAMWVKASSIGTSALFSCRKGAGGGAAIFCYSGGQGIRLDLNGTNSYVTYTWPLNTWVHIAYTFDGSKKRVYINGLMIGEINQSASSLSKLNTKGTVFGCSQQSDSMEDNNYFWNGYIQDIQVWDEALTDITSIM